LDGNREVGALQLLLEPLVLHAEGEPRRAGLALGAGESGPATLVPGLARGGLLCAGDRVVLGQLPPPLGDVGSIEALTAQQGGLLAHVRAGIELIEDAALVSHREHALAGRRHFDFGDGAGGVFHENYSLALGEVFADDLCHPSLTHRGAGPRPRGHPPDFTKRIARAQAAQTVAHAALIEANAHQETRQAAVTGLSCAYHPFDLATGVARTAADVDIALTAHFDALDTLAAATSLSQRSVARLAKARRQLPAMVATVRFFWKEVDARIALADWPEAVEESFVQSLLPAAYLYRVAARCGRAEVRHGLECVAKSVLKTERGECGAVASLDADAQGIVEDLAWACADVFQRSSSCVEGRNGTLALAEHARRGLSERRLKALTVVANYVQLNSEGTTAAQRFFGQTHDDLFAWLLKTMPMPARPARKRPKAAKQTLLEAA
jgi:hypothetical protein